MEFAQAGAVEIAYARAGDGPPLVFVHGAALDGRMWRPQLQALADEFTVVAWDEPGAGRSSDLPDGFALANYAECLAAVIEAVDLGPAHIAGLSWGGTVLLELFRRRPSVIGTAIFVDTYAGWKGSLPAAEVEVRLAGVRQQLAAPRESFDPTVPGLFSNEPSPDLEPLLSEMAGAVRPETLEVQMDLMAAADQSDVLPTLAVPTLLVWGPTTCAPRSPSPNSSRPRSLIQARRHPRLRSHEQSRAARSLQRRDPRVLPRQPPRGA